MYGMLTPGLRVIRYILGRNDLASVRSLTLLHKVYGHWREVE